MATEDFTTYTETDPNSKITVTAAKVAWLDMPRNETSHVILDKGVDHFNGDFTHLLEVFQDATEANSDIYHWAISNSVNDLKSIQDASGDHFGILVDFTAFLMHECDGGTVSNGDIFTMVVDTIYYLEIERDESIGSFGDAICRVYNDSVRTDLEFTSTNTIASSKKDFRYVYGFSSYNVSGTQETDGYSKDLDLQEAAPAGIRSMRQLVGHGQGTRT